MTDLAKLVVRMEAQTAQMQSELEKANQKLDRFAQKASSAGKLVASALAAGAAAGATALVGLLAKAVEAGDKLDKMSIRVGVSVENLSRLAFAAERTGVSQDAMNKSLQVMQKNLSEVASTGKGEAVDALNELGLSAKKLAALSPEQQFLALAEGFKSVENQGDKVRLAMKVLGEEGVSLLQTMEGGAAAVAALAAESDALGNTMSTESASAAAKFKDTITNLEGALNQTGNVILARLGPSLESMANALQDILPQAAEYASKAFIKMQGVLLGSAGYFQKFVGTVQSGLSSVLDFVGAGGLAGSFDRASQEALTSADILFKTMEQKFAEGSSSLKSAAQTNAPKLSDLIPDLASVRGTNASAAGDAKAESLAKKAADSAAREAERLRTENANIVSLAQERFRRLHEEALAAEGRTVQLEQERYAREQSELNAEVERMRQRGLLTAQIEEQFRQAQLNAQTVHQDRLTKIDEEGAAARDEVRRLQLEATGNFFGALGAAMKEGSKAQRALFAAEKAAALAQSLIALQTAIAKANALGFPANIPAIASAVSIGASAISSIKSVQFGGARAEGGPVSRGSAYLVGERGPELFMPGSTGNITPNHELGGVNVTIIENPQKAGTVERDQDAVRIFVARVKSEIATDISTGRGIAQNFQQTYGLRRVGSV